MKGISSSRVCQLHNLTFGVLVRERRAEALHHGAGSEVLRGNELETASLGQMEEGDDTRVSKRRVQAPSGQCDTSRHSSGVHWRKSPRTCSQAQQHE